MKILILHFIKQQKQLIYHHKVWRASFYIHVFTSPIIIVSGLLQFSTYLQRKKRTLHRLIGKTYLITLLFISAPAAFIMSLYANGGRIAQTSFVLLSICWILTSWLALIKAKKGNIESHVKWMIRSYALTLSAITLRFYSYLFDVFQFQLDPKTTYILLSYISWIPNLLIAEILIRMKYPEYLKYNGEEETMSLDMFSANFDIYACPTEFFYLSESPTIGNIYTPFSLNHNYNEVVTLLNTGKNKFLFLGSRERSREDFEIFHGIDLKLIKRLPFDANDVAYDPDKLDFNKVDARRFVAKTKSIH